MARSNVIIDFLIIFCLYVTSIVGFNDQLNSFALYVIIPFASVLTVFRYKFNVGYSMKWLLFLYLWMIFTCLFAEHLDLASRQLKQIIGCVLLSFIMAQNAKKPSMVPWLYGVYILVFISSIYYGLTNILDASYDIGSDRLNDDNLNANTLAYFLLYSTFAIFILADIVNRKLLSRIFRIGFWLMIPVTFYVAIFTASRQILLTSIPLLLMLFFIRYIKGAKRKYIFQTLIIIAVAGAFVVPKFMDIYENSFLKERTKIDLNEDSRILLLKDAINVGLENPVVGVGPGNYVMYSYNKHFSHCSYTELFANSGILALILYIGLIWTFMKRQFKRYGSHKNAIYLAFIVFGLIFIVDNVFFVFYNNLWLISFFILVSTHSDTNEKLSDLNYK